MRISRIYFLSPLMMSFLLGVSIDAWSGPVISNVVVKDISAHTARLTWDTDVPSNSQVEYGDAPGNWGVIQLTDPRLTTAHSQYIVGLTPAHTVYFAVKSSDQGGARTMWPDGVFTTAASDTLPASDLVAEWKFDEMGGVNAVDSSGNLNHTVFFDSLPSWEAGRIGGAVSFNGVNQQMSTFRTNAFDFTKNTVSFFFKPRSTWNASSGRKDLANNDCGGFGIILNAGVSDGTLTATINCGNGAHTMTNTWTADRWYHFAASQDGDQTRIYVDGILETAMTTANVINGSGDGAFDVGGMMRANFADAAMDEVCVFKKVLSASQIGVLKNGQPCDSIDGPPVNPPPANPPDDCSPSPQGNGSEWKNVVNPSKKETANFPCDGSATIFARDGRKVATEESENGIVTWDGTNEQGAAVASGTYTAVCHDGEGEKRFKLAVIK